MLQLLTLALSLLFPVPYWATLIWPWERMGKPWVTEPGPHFLTIYSRENHDLVGIAALRGSLWFSSCSVVGLRQGGDRQSSSKILRLFLILQRSQVQPGFLKYQFYLGSCSGNQGQTRPLLGIWKSLCSSGSSCTSWRKSYWYFLLPWSNWRWQSPLWTQSLLGLEALKWNLTWLLREKTQRGSVRSGTGVTE